MTDSHFRFGHATSEGDNDVVIKWCKDHDEEDWEDGKGGWGNC